MEVFGAMAMIMGLAALGGILARILKQPVILGYIVAGIVISTFGGKWVTGSGFIDIMGQIGVTLLLFLAGMELPIAELKKVGRVAIVTGLGQVVVSASLGYGLSRLLGWGSQSALYLGLGLSFGSTILLVKLLSERGDLQSLPGKIAVGYLLVQDFVAVGVLVMLSGAASGNFGLSSLGILIVKAIILVAGSLMVSQKMVSLVLKYLNQSTELLFITAIGWCMVVAAVVASPVIGFSIEIGGFLAGLSLASAMEQGQIASRVRPVRDFFLTWFFVALGAKFKFGEIGGYLGVVALFSIFVTVVNPLIVMLLLGAQGYKKRVAFMSALAMSSVSEFSLIMAAAAVRISDASNSLLTVLTMTALITMIGESYLIGHAHEIYRKISPWLNFVNLTKKIVETEKTEEYKDHIVLFGHNRIGRVVRPALEKLGVVIVVDFNPEVVEKLFGEGIKAVYGDMSDHEMYEDLGLKQAKLVLSTIPDINDSLRMLLEMKSWKRKPVVMMTAVDDEDASRLYKAGADFVLVPHSVGGEYIAQALEVSLQNLPDKVARLGERHQGRLSKS